jgi:cellulose synthase/poly-beta-1,6-N-acetylglucosamine synthase-like glycosyltransferase
MGHLVTLLQAWSWIVVGILLLYAVRHWYFTLNRVSARQRPSYQDLLDSDLPAVSIIIPMRNEGRVATAIFDALIASNYPHDLLEILPVDDQSEDDTPTIAYTYSQRYPFIKPIYNLHGERGKPNALNRALSLASHEIVLVFDADYTPG